MLKRRLRLRIHDRSAQEEEARVRRVNVLDDRVHGLDESRDREGQIEPAPDDALRQRAHAAVEDERKAAPEHEIVQPDRLRDRPCPTERHARDERGEGDVRRLEHGPLPLAVETERVAARGTGHRSVQQRDLHTANRTHGEADGEKQRQERRHGRRAPEADTGSGDEDHRCGDREGAGAGRDGARRDGDQQSGRLSSRPASQDIPPRLTGRCARHGVGKADGRIAGFAENLVHARES